MTPDIPAPSRAPEQLTCACVSFDAERCIRLRYPYADEHEYVETERCECACHEDEADE